MEINVKISFSDRFEEAISLLAQHVSGNTAPMAAPQSMAAPVLETPVENEPEMKEINREQIMPGLRALCSRKKAAGHDIKAIVQKYSTTGKLTGVPDDKLDALREEVEAL